MLTLELFFLDRGLFLTRFAHYSILIEHIEVFQLRFIHMIELRVTNLLTRFLLSYSIFWWGAFGEIVIEIFFFDHVLLLANVVDEVGGLARGLLFL
jgi:hypothetical protein